MTSFEAVQRLADRARRFSRTAWLLGVGAIFLGCGLALTLLWVFLSHVGGPISG